MTEKKRFVALTRAQVSSGRLPSTVLALASQRVLRRVSRAETIDAVAVATVESGDFAAAGGTGRLAANAGSGE